MEKTIHQFILIFDNSGDILFALGNTLFVTLFAFIIAIFLGIFVAVVRFYNLYGNRFFAVYVAFFRGSPLLIQLFLFYYGLPSLGLNLPRFPAAIIVIGLNGAAYISEIVRGGLKAVAPGQMEAAQVLGLTRAERIFYIALPQALRVVLPALVNSFSSVFKDSSLASVLSIMELTRMGQLIYTRTYRAFEIYIVIALVYFAVTELVAFFSRKIEARLH